MQNTKKFFGNGAMFAIAFCAAFLLTAIVVPLIAADGGEGFQSASSQGAFEKPISGSTGWAARATGMPLRSAPNVNSPVIQDLSHGTAFTILDEAGSFWYVRLGGAQTTGHVQHRYAFINLPDIIQSIDYNITNADSSMFRTFGNSISGITGQQLYSARSYNPRLGHTEYIVPILYATAHRLMTAQNAALADGNTIVLYEAFRPFPTQVQVYNAFTPAMRNAFTTPWTFSWFLWLFTPKR